MEKKIEDYLHLYIGCDAVMSTDHWHEPEGDKRVKVTGIAHEARDYVFYLCESGTGNSEIKYFKPILRTLESMTEAELNECGNMVYDFSNDEWLLPHKWEDFELMLCPEQSHWLIQRHFDLFGLIDAGLALNAAEVNK